MIFSKTSILNQTSILCKRKTLSQMKCALQIHHTYLVYFSSHKAHNNSNNNNNNAKCEPQKMYQLQDPRNCHLWLSNKIIFLHSFPYRDICSFKPIFFISFLTPSIQIIFISLVCFWHHHISSLYFLYHCILYQNLWYLQLQPITNSIFNVMS